MKAAAYARVSTADQVDGFSLSAQLRAIRAHCASQGWTLAAEYTDEGVSASRESAALRPSFRQLMEDVDAGKVDVVIVHKLDRFSRNLTVTLQSLGRIDRAGAAFVSVVEHIDMATPMGRLARLRELYLEGDMPRARYDAERGRLQAEIERCEVELASVSFAPVATLTAIQEAWPEATDEERARMAQLILEEVHIDIDAKEVLYVKPRAAMLPLFELVRDETVWPGDLGKPWPHYPPR